MEHHSEITPNLMRRDYNYITTVCEASKQNVEPFIFNTGAIPKEKVTYVNDKMFYNPKFINTREIRGIVNLNNRRYKVKHKQELTAYDALDLIWLVKTKIDINRGDLVLELTVDIWAKATAEKWILDSIRKNLILWAGKYLISEEKIKEFKGAVKMSKIEIKPIEEQIRGARIDGELERAEERGHANGLKEGLEIATGTEEKFVLGLLKTHTPEEISIDFDVSHERIHEIINDNS